MIYYTGHVGRPWQVQSTYLNKKRNRNTDAGRRNVEI